MSVSRVWCAVAVVAASVLGVATPASAQFGVRGGLNLSTLTLDPEDEDAEFSFKPDLVAGVFFVAAREAPLGLQVEALYSRRGSNVEDVSVASFNFDYFEVPVLARIRAASYDTGQLYLLAGPSFGVNLLKAEREDTDDEIDDVKEFLKSNDVAIMLGLGVDFGRIVIDGRYMQGLVNINEDDEPSLKNRTLMFTIGVYFD